MFDFLYSEVWWMETIIAAAIGVIGTIFAAVFAYRSGVKEKLQKILDQIYQVIKWMGASENTGSLMTRLQDSERNIEEDIKKRLGNTEDYGSITAQIQKVQEVNRRTEDNWSTVKFTLQDLSEKAQREEKKEQALSLDTKAMLDVLSKLMEDYKELNYKYQLLLEKAEKLMQENEQLRKENRILKEEQLDQMQGHEQDEEEMEL